LWLSINDAAMNLGEMIARKETLPGWMKLTTKPAN
jgi:hypothetical protein